MAGTITMFSPEHCQNCSLHYTACGSNMTGSQHISVVLCVDYLTNDFQKSRLAEVVRYHGLLDPRLSGFILLFCGDICVSLRTQRLLPYIRRGSSCPNSSSSSRGNNIIDTPGAYPSVRQNMIRRYNLCLHVNGGFCTSTDI